MADALSLLREYNMNKKAITEENDVIQLGDFSWPKDIKTNYVIWGTGKDGNKKEYYTLESILFLLKNVELLHPQYVRRAATEDIPVVRRPDRKDLLAYLNGVVSNSNSIDKSAPLDVTLQRPSKVIKRNVLSTTQLDDGKTQLEPLNKKARLDDNQKSTIRSSKRLDELLDGKAREKAVTTSGLASSLSEALSDEKIASIKAKYIAQRRKVIQSTEETRNYEDGEVREDTTEVLAREKMWRTRSSVLQSGVKNFSKNVFTILSAIKNKEEGKQESETQSTTSNNFASNSISSSYSRNSISKKPPQHVAGYSRYDQERFRGKEGTLGFQIDTTGTYHDMSLKSVMEGATTKKILPTPKQHSISKPASNVVQKPQKRVSRTPIIIIPASVTSLVTLYNAKDLLQELKFIPTSVKKAEGVRRDNEVLIQRRKSNGSMTVPYRIIDNISKLQTPDDWDRVVAVFVQGPSWQFKGWPWLLSDGSPVDIFSKIQAFHVKFIEQRLEANVSKWNVHVMQLSETKRHMDRAVLYKFWEVLDRFMMKNKSHLRF